MTNYVVSSGQTSNGITLRSGDTETVLAGGIAINTVVSSGGSMVVSSGGVASKTVISSGGTETVVAGGTVNGAVASAGGVEIVSSGGTTNNLLVGSGGVERGYAGGLASGTQILSGGAVNLASRIFTAGGTADLNYSTDLLTIVIGGVTLQDQLSGTYTGEYFHLTSAATGTLVTLNSTPCYCRGTMILTEHGERPVEELAIGDRIATLDGPMAIKWIGRRGYSGRFARGNATVLPIRVAAGAIADGVPSRDLWISPKHALLLDGVLVPAEALVNGTSVTRAHDVDSVEYFHVELDRHAILVADGAPAESFVDDNSRFVFHNAHEHADRYPDACPTPAVYCAPRHEDGERVEAIRHRMALRAEPTASIVDGFGGLRGSVDAFDGERLHGWAQHAARPEVPVCLELLRGDVVVARVLANRYRDDLRRGGVGSGCHAFEAAIPEHLRSNARVRGPQALRVRRVADGAELANALWATQDRAA